jgi:hypothetical protein
MFDQQPFTAKANLSAGQLLAARMPVVIRVSGSGWGCSVQLIEQEPTHDPGDPPRQRSRN